MTDNSRPRGVTVRPLPAASGPFDSYALLAREDGKMWMVHSEGVAYIVSEDKPWRWNDFSENAEVWTPGDLLVLALHRDTRSVDLADWIRTHNARLESNFAQIYHAAKS